MPRCTKPSATAAIAVSRRPEARPWRSGASAPDPLVAASTCDSIAPCRWIPQLRPHRPVRTAGISKACSCHTRNSCASATPPSLKVLVTSTRAPIRSVLICDPRIHRPMPGSLNMPETWVLRNALPPWVLAMPFCSPQAIEARNKDGRVARLLQWHLGKLSSGRFALLLPQGKWQASRLTGIRR